MTYKQLTEKYYRAFFINSKVERHANGFYLVSGLAYLDKSVPAEVELFDSDSRIVGTVRFKRSLLDRIKMAMSAANTRFEFTPTENNHV